MAVSALHSQVSQPYNAICLKKFCGNHCVSVLLKDTIMVQFRTYLLVCFNDIFTLFS